MSDDVREKIDGFPDRHPFPVRCVLYLVFFVCPAVPWEAVSALLTSMGYCRITLEKKGTILGHKATLATTTWTTPDEQALNIPEGMVNP